VTSSMDLSGGHCDRSGAVASSRDLSLRGTVTSALGGLGSAVEADVGRLSDEVTRATTEDFPSTTSRRCAPTWQGLPVKSGLPHRVDERRVLDDFEVLAGGLVLIEMVEGDASL
jgi:hypothetical protein